MRLTRREALRALLGGAAPVAAGSLGVRAVAAQPPGRAGGPLRVLWWQAPTHLNPHFALGAKDADGARIFYEPLFTWDADGTLIPVLASRVPTFDNGDLGRDGRVTLRLKRGVVWHDGAPFTADDVVFNWEYAADPATAATTIGDYRGVDHVERVDHHTVVAVFKKPTPRWFAPFTDAIIPRHVFAPYRGRRSREAPANLKPVGTGPYRYVEFRPGDLIRAARNPAYHVAGRPFFDTLELKGGGDAVSAARAVLQTGEYDYAWNVQVEDDVLRRLESGGKGAVHIVFGGTVEYILCNMSDPWTTVNGERSNPAVPHPILSDPAVRSALALLVDRATIQAEIYGRTGRLSANVLNGPDRYDSRDMTWAFDPDRAARTLDAAGWKRGPDGIRVKDGRKLRFLFQTTVNAPRQKAQVVIKQACARAGIALELKAVSPATYFGSDPANPDTGSRFLADLEMHATFRAEPEPAGLMESFVSWQIASKANQWQGQNVCRFVNAEVDALFRASEAELDPAKRAALFIRMNDLVVQSGVVIPIVRRARVTAISRRLRHAEPGPWGSDFWRLAEWSRDG